jgi:transposase
VTVAENAGVAAKTVRAVARRYEKEGLDAALYENPLPGLLGVLNAGQKQRISFPLHLSSKLPQVCQS